MSSSKILIVGATIVNENQSFTGWISIEDGIITSVNKGEYIADERFADFQKTDARGLTLMPGVIDDQVHFRDPGLTYKGDIASESRAAVAGGVTSFMDMPNTIPNCLTQPLLEEKYQHAA